MPEQVTIVYNAPEPSRYDGTGEIKAVAGVLEAVDAVTNAMKELGNEVKLMPLLMPFERAEAELATIKTGTVFNLFEGFCGYPETEALIPSFLAGHGIPFTGCPAAALSLGLDKAKTKELLTGAGINTPHYQVLHPGTLTDFKLNFPCIVKPFAEDASHGLTTDSVVHDYKGLEKQVGLISEHYNGKALVEEFLTGREFNATVMGNVTAEVLPASEIIYELPDGLPHLLTFEAKWEENSTYYRHTPVICPAKLADRELKTLNHMALASFGLTGCRGYARVNMRMDEAGELFVIEVNPNPDISPTAGSVRQAKAASMNYTQFIEHILSFADKE